MTDPSPPRNPIRAPSIMSQMYNPHLILPRAITAPIAHGRAWKGVARDGRDRPTRLPPCPAHSDAGIPICRRAGGQVSAAPATRRRAGRNQDGPPCPVPEVRRYGPGDRQDGRTVSAALVAARPAPCCSASAPGSGILERRLKVGTCYGTLSFLKRQCPGINI